MVFKHVSGVSADTYQLWTSADSLNENKTEALNVNSSFKAHYKNRFVKNWQISNPKEVASWTYYNNPIKCTENLELPKFALLAKAPDTIGVSAGAKETLVLVLKGQSTTNWPKEFEPVRCIEYFLKI